MRKGGLPRTGERCQVKELRTAEESCWAWLVDVKGSLYYAYEWLDYPHKLIKTSLVLNKVKRCWWINVYKHFYTCQVTEPGKSIFCKHHPSKPGFQLSVFSKYYVNKILHNKGKRICWHPFSQPQGNLTGYCNWRMTNQDYKQISVLSIHCVRTDKGK